MARNGSGVYSLPPGSTITNGDTSDATDINTPLADIVTDLNAARPIVAGGTGATSVGAAQTALKIPPFDGSATISGTWDFSGAVTASGTLDLSGATVTYGAITVPNGGGRDVVLSTGGAVSAATVTAYGEVSSRSDGNPGLAYRDASDTLNALFYLNRALTPYTFDATLYDTDGTNGRVAARIEDVGTTATYATTIMTREKGDARFAGAATVIGIGQTWQDVSGSRAHSTAYQNTEDAPIQVSISGASASAARDFEVSSSGAFAGEEVSAGLVGGNNSFTNAIVPPDHYYRVNGSTTINNWTELR